MLRPLDRRWRGSPLAAVIGVVAAAGVGRGEVVSGFESGGDLQRWSAIGTIEGRRLPGPPPPAAEPAGPAGGAVRLSTPGRAGFFLKAGEVPAAVARFDTLSFWIHRSPPADGGLPPSTIEVRFYEADGKAWFWRRVVLDHAGWRRIVVPLKWTRWSDSRVPRWDSVDRLGIYFRDAADVVVDAFELVDEPPPNGPDDEPTVAARDVAAVAFGPEAVADGDARVAERDGLAVVTDAPQLDSGKLLDHLQRVCEAVGVAMPFARERSRPAILVVFADEEDYGRFVPAVAARLDSQAAPPQSDGFTFLGIATSSWNPKLGTLRPVYTHEFVHSLLTASLLLDNRSEWFQEGMASHFQLRFHPQAGFDALVIENLEREGPDALEKVCDGSRIGLDRYWVAATLCRMLLEDEELSRRLPAVVADMQGRGSTALGPTLPILGLSWEELDGRWRAFCRGTYGAP